MLRALSVQVRYAAPAEPPLELLLAMRPILGALGCWSARACAWIQDNQAEPEDETPRQNRRKAELAHTRRRRWMDGGVKFKFSYFT